MEKIPEKKNNFAFFKKSHLFIEWPILSTKIFLNFICILLHANALGRVMNNKMNNEIEKFAVYLMYVDTQPLHHG